MTIAGTWLFAACLLYSWGNSAWHALYADRMVYTRGMRPLRIPFNAIAVGVLLGTAAMVTGLVYFSRGVAPGIAGLAVFGLIAVMRMVETRQWKGNQVIDLGKYVPAAACLAAHVIVYGLTWGANEEARRAVAWEAACGVLAATYVLSGVHKLRHGGRQWLRPSNLALLVAERVYQGPPMLRRARRWLVGQKRMCSFLSHYGLWMEIGAIGFIFPTLRWPVAIATTLMHIGIIVFLGYVELEWIFLMIALAMITEPSLMSLIGG